MDEQNTNPENPAPPVEETQPSVENNSATPPAGPPATEKAISEMYDRLFVKSSRKAAEDGEVTTDKIEVVRIEGSVPLTKTEAEYLNSFYVGIQPHGVFYFPKGQKKVGDII